MKDQEYISIRTICRCHGVSESLIIEMSELDLIELEEVEDEKMIREYELSTLEKFMRLHNELDINLAGIEVVHNLTQRLEEMEREMDRLRKQLAIYESE